MYPFAPDRLCLTRKEVGANPGRYLRRMYDLLNAYFGDLHWWPADSAFEVVVGAILTQNTAWHNVTLAISKLKDADLLTPEGLDRVEPERLAGLIRSAGYYRIKTERLKAFVCFLKAEYGGSLCRLAAEGTDALRIRMLQVRGIGEETADSILLYACQKPVFVVDAYTKRILSRHAVVNEQARYLDVQSLFMSSLPLDVPLYNQFHALFVQTGKEFCRKEKRCQACPLKELALYKS